MAEKDSNIVDVERDLAARKEVLDPMFAKGQSKRIWGELYKVRGKAGPSARTPKCALKHAFRIDRNR